MSHFRLLKDPGNYVPQDWDFVKDTAGREFWLNHFEAQFAQSMKHALEQYGRTAHKKATAATVEMNAALAKLRSEPASLPSGKLNMIELDLLRDGILRKSGVDDPYKNIRTRANTAAMKLYPQLVREVHALAKDARFLRLMQCVLAGNILDLGSAATMHLADQPLDFFATLKAVKPRPWLVDQFDAISQDLSALSLKWSKAVIFVDNAGADFVLGVMPLAREMALSGTKIVLAANERPALNDMTADETAVLVERLALIDDDLAALIKGEMFEVVSSGNNIPVMDLGNVSDELNTAAEGAELVILEGMGRALETNYNAEFTVDTLKVALIKNEDVARRFNGQMYDCVCKYDRVETKAS